MRSADKLRVVIADGDTRARSSLAAILRTFGDVNLVGEGLNGVEALALIESKRPALALLDFHLPELAAFPVIRLLKRAQVPLVTFLTALDEYDISIFEANGLDYIIKPAQPPRLRQALDRVKNLLDQEDHKFDEIERIRVAAADYKDGKLLMRIPVRQQDHIILIPVAQLVSIVAKGEYLHLRTTNDGNYTMCYRLQALAARLDPARFVRVGRGAIVNIDMIRRIVPVAGGIFTIELTDNQEFQASRIQSRILRERLLRL